MQPTSVLSATEFVGETPVLLSVYDLSHGRAARMSPFLLGQVIPGIWHTSVEVYGYEYFYGGSLVKMKPKDVRFVLNMDPVHVLKMGNTIVPMAEFDQFLCSKLNDYTPEKYDLVTHNCNHFTNMAMQFLIKKNIPQEILDLPQKVNNTVVGRFLLKLLQKATDNQNPVPVERPVPKRASCYVEPDLESDQAVHHGVSRGTWQPMTVTHSRHPMSRRSDGGGRRREHRKQLSCSTNPSVAKERVIPGDEITNFRTEKRSSHLSIPSALSKAPPSFVCGENLHVIRSLKTSFPYPKPHTIASPRKPNPPALFPVTEAPLQVPVRKPVSVPPVFLARSSPRPRSAKRPPLEQSTLQKPTPSKPAFSVPQRSTRPPPSFVLPTREHRSVCLTEKDAVSGMMRLLTPRPGTTSPEAAVIHSPYRQGPSYTGQRSMGYQSTNETVSRGGVSQRFSNVQHSIPVTVRPVQRVPSSAMRLAPTSQQPTLPRYIYPPPAVRNPAYPRARNTQVPPVFVHPTTGSPLAVVHEVNRQAPVFVVPSTSSGPTNYR